MSYPLDPMYFYYLISAFDVSNVVQLFESVKLLEAEKNDNIVDFLNYCIVARIIFIEKVEQPQNVKISYIDYLWLHENLNGGKTKVTVVSEPFTVVKCDVDGLKFEGDEVEQKYL